jgi:hypothetical protein
VVLHTGEPKSTGVLDLAGTHGALIELDLPPVALHAKHGARSDRVNSMVGG